MTGPREASSDASGAPPVSDGLASVVLIERRDDIAGICGRLDAAPTYAVVVHAPGGNRQLSTQLGIRRLQRHAEDTGRVIAIATRSRSLAARARQAGIPVSRRPEHVRWDAPGRRVVRLPGVSLALPGVGRYVQFAVLAAACLAIVGLAVLMGPTATVRLTPPMREFTARVLVDASPDRDTADVPAARLRAQEVSATRRVTLAAPATGTALVPATRATVLITMSNTGSTQVVVPKGEILLAQPSGLRFQVDQETSVPASKTVVQQASALDPGEIGNIPAGALGSWDDASLKSVSVSNAAPGSGGASEERPAVSEADVLGLLALADSMTTSPAIRQAVIDANPGFGVFLRTAAVEVATADPVPAVGAPAEILVLDVAFEITALAVGEADLLALVLDRLGPGAPGPLVSGSVRAVETGARQSDIEEDGVMTSEFDITAAFADGVTASSVRSAIHGRLTSRARSHLEDRYGIENVELDMNPGVAPLVPWFQFRIDVEFRPVNPGEPAKTQDADRTPTNTATASPSPRP